MNILTKPKQIIKSTVVASSALALLVVPTTAFAHGSSGGNGRDDNRQSSGQSKHGNRNQDDNWRKHRADHQKTCDERQQALNQKATQAHDRSQKQLNGLNIVLSGVQTYVTSEEIVVENYDSLNAKATADQASATAAVEAITAPQLNCGDESDNSSNNSSAELSNKIKTAKQSLSAYKHDVKILFEAAIES